MSLPSHYSCVDVDLGIHWVSAVLSELNQEGKITFQECKNMVRDFYYVFFEKWKNTEDEEFRNELMDTLVWFELEEK